MLVTLSCGGGSAPPTTTTTTTTLAPKPTPTPPGSTAGFHDLTCSLGKGEPEANCRQSPPQTIADVEGAMDKLVSQKPQIFSLNDQNPPGSNAYKVLDREAYMEGLVANLRASGGCAERDPDDAAQAMIRVKYSNDYSEDLTVILSTNYMLRGRGMYWRTCYPGAFPVDREADAPPIASGCFRPYPPQVTRFQCKEFIPSRDYSVLDSTPMVGPDPYYCGLIGFVGRTICPLRPEDWEDRSACENWRVGKAKDTGRPGPTWTKADGSFCTGQASGCANVPENQYQLNVYQRANGTTYTVTAANGADCVVTF